jgi:transposase
MASAGRQPQRAGGTTLVRVEFVVPKSGQRNFRVQPRRWVIKRAFAWTGRCRRPAHDHEATPGSAIAFFVLAAATIVLSRLAKLS